MVSASSLEHASRSVFHVPSCALTCAPSTSSTPTSAQRPDASALAQLLGTSGSARADALNRGSSVHALGNLRYVEEFEILEQLGHGFFGVVTKVREKRGASQHTKGRRRSSRDNHPLVMVMKEPIVQSASLGWSAKKIISREYFMLRLLKHPNVIKTRGICLQQASDDASWKLNLLVDYCDLGSLQQAILNGRPFSWALRCRVAADICNAMQYLNSLGYMHRDLTSMNVLLQSQTGCSNPRAIVADFGLFSRIPKPNEIKQPVGTANFMSPEALMERFYDEKTDVFSFGIVLCQMIARIDADHDSGLYRTPVFGLDYVRFTAHCPTDTPLSLLKTAFLSCLWNAESRPSFSLLYEELQRIIAEELPKSDRNADDATLFERSHSEATIRSNQKAPLLLSLVTARRDVRPPVDFDVVSTIYERSPPLSPRTSTLSTDDGAELGDRIKELATSVASGDPAFKESSLNPFSSHDRYRSIRKFRPGDSAQAANGVNARRATHLDDAADSTSTQKAAATRVQSRKRSASLPSLLLSSIEPIARRPHTSKNSKRFFTLGLGEQRDLQGRITMTFRDYDKRFTASTSRSGVLVSSQELRHDSADSLDDLPPPSPPHSDEDERSVVSVGDETLVSRCSALYDESSLIVASSVNDDLSPLTTPASADQNPASTIASKEAARVYPVSGGGGGGAAAAAKQAANASSSSAKRSARSSKPPPLRRSNNERSCTIS